MWWVWIMVAAAVAGAVMLVAFGVVLWRKARTVFEALGELGGHAETALGLLDGIGAPTETVGGTF